MRKPMPDREDERIIAWREQSRPLWDAFEAAPIGSEARERAWQAWIAAHDAELWRRQRAGQG